LAGAFFAGAFLAGAFFAVALAMPSPVPHEFSSWEPFP
jgi:hypothetical protein